MRKFCTSQDYSPSAHRVARQLCLSAFLMLWMPNLTIYLHAKANSCPSPETHLCRSTWVQWGSPNRSVRQHKQPARGSWHQRTPAAIPSFSRKSFVRKMPSGIPSFPGNTEGVLFQIQIEASWTPKVITDFGFTLFMPLFMLLYLQVYSATAAALWAPIFQNFQHVLNCYHLSSSI